MGNFFKKAGKFVCTAFIHNNNMGTKDLKKQVWIKLTLSATRSRFTMLAEICYQDDRK